MIQDPPPGKYLVSKRYNLKEKEPGPKIGEARRLEIRDERRALALANKREMKPGETAAKSAQHLAQNLDQNGRRAMTLVSRATPQTKDTSNLRGLGSSFAGLPDEGTPQHIVAQHATRLLGDKVSAAQAQAVAQQRQDLAVRGATKRAADLEELRDKQKVQTLRDAFEPLPTTREEKQKELDAEKQLADELKLKVTKGGPERAGSEDVVGLLSSERDERPDISEEDFESYLEDE